MKSATLLTKFAVVGIATVFVSTGCVSRTYYPADITNVKPYSRPARRPVELKSATSAAKAAPIALQVQTPPSVATPLPQTAPAVAEQSNGMLYSPPAPISATAQSFSPASRSNATSKTIPGSLTAPSGSLAEQIRVIQELRRKGVFTQDESDKFVLRVVEQAK